MLQCACGWLCSALDQPHLDSTTSHWPRSEVLEGANELRIMLCRPKEGGGERSSTSIVAACGIYMKACGPPGC